MLDPFDPKEHWRDPRLTRAWEIAHLTGRTQVVVTEDGARIITPAREGRRARIDALIAPQQLGEHLEKSLRA